MPVQSHLGLQLRPSLGSAPDNFYDAAYLLDLGLAFWRPYLA